jgi:hypothetical protein
LLGSAISGFGFNEGMCPLEALNTLLNIYFDPPPPEVSPGRLIIGTLGGLIFFIPGTILIAAGIAAISTHGDPAGALPLAVGGVLDAIAAEIIYQTWRPLLPQSWPEYIILNPEGALGH